MTGGTLTPTPPADASLRPLYGRYKRLALAAGAGMLLGRVDEAIAGDALLLAGDADLAMSARPELRGPLNACHEAALALHRLVAAPPGDVPARLVDARATQRSLRDEMWAVIDCEYAPCGTQTHAHEKGSHHG